jgi:cytochrome c553
MRQLIASAAASYVIAVALALPAATQPASGPSTPDGKSVFRYDTFGDEQLWTDTLAMEQAIASVDPATALSVGLKVDSDALPQTLVDAIKAGKVNLKDPAVTIQLLKLNAIVGVIGKVGGSGELKSVGTACALCHSTVDNAVAAGIGKRLDGWPNRDLNVGAIIALSPKLTAQQKAVFNGWGAGKYDPRLNAFDGRTLIALNATTVPVVIPPAYGLKGVGFETFTGDGPVSYWNSYVGVTQMGGHGSFSDSRLGLRITQTPDLVTPRLPALLQYQLGLAAPAPPAGSFDRVAARRGERLFNGAARCATCHIAPAFTDVSSGPDPKVPVLHEAAEVGADPAYASRTVNRKYRTSPLRGVWQHPPYFHDGSAADLLAVVNHYDRVFSLGLNERQKRDVVEFLKSL